MGAITDTTRTYYVDGEQRSFADLHNNPWSYREAKEVWERKDGEPFDLTNPGWAGLVRRGGVVSDDGKTITKTYRPGDI